MNKLSLTFASKAEAEILLKFLEELSDKFGNAGCNDMYLSDSTDHRQLEFESNRHNLSKINGPLLTDDEVKDHPDYFEPHFHDNSIATSDIQILGLYIGKLKRVLLESEKK